jgi:hypothetical protein
MEFNDNASNEKYRIDQLVGVRRAVEKLHKWLLVWLSIELALVRATRKGGK